jgi:thioredoxin reductase (NADPH)
LNKTTNEEFDIPATGFFVAVDINLTPIFLRFYLLMKRVISLIPRSSKTNVTGVFVAGC